MNWSRYAVRPVRCTIAGGADAAARDSRSSSAYAGHCARPKLDARDAGILAGFPVIGLRFRLDGNFDYRLGKIHAFEQHRRVGIAKCVAGGRVLQPG